MHSATETETEPGTEPGTATGTETETETETETGRVLAYACWYPRAFTRMRAHTHTVSQIKMVMQRNGLDFPTPEEEEEMRAQSSPANPY